MTNKISNKDYISDEILDDLSNIYRPVEIPKCCVCGKEMTLQDSRDKIFGCTGMIDDPEEYGHLIYEEGRSFLDDHYRLSRRTLFHIGDRKIFELINAYKNLRMHIFKR